MFRWPELFLFHDSEHTSFLKLHGELASLSTVETSLKADVEMTEALSLLQICGLKHVYAAGAACGGVTG